MVNIHFPYKKALFLGRDAINFMRPPLIQGAKGGLAFPLSLTFTGDFVIIKSKFGIWNTKII